jgi:excisionase family DNA binding protein
MSEENDIPKIPGYVSVKEAAAILNVTDKTIYFYIDNKRLQAVRASNMLLIPKEEIERFQQRSVGRPRTKTPSWRSSTKDNALLVTSIHVPVKSGKHTILGKKLAKLRREGLHNFPGTVARYILGFEENPDEVEILLVWKVGIMPDQEEREKLLQVFQEELSDVLNWGKAQYHQGTVFMHA